MKVKYWQNRILFDSETGKFYALFLRNGVYSLQEIDVRSGQIRNATIIRWPFISNIKLHNGYAYFTYRPDIMYPASKCLKQLYKIRLN